MKKGTPAKRARTRGTAHESNEQPGMENLQEVMDAAVNEELIGIRPVVLGKELRPVTLASVALLKSAGSPLIEGKALNEIPNVILDCCIFIVLQSRTLPEAAQLVRDPDALEMAALELADEIPAHAIHTITNAILALLKDATSTQVKAEPPKDGKKGSGDLDPGNK